MKPAELQYIARVIAALARAGHGQKDAIVQEACETLNCSVPTLYRKIKEAGHDSGRRTREDAGQSQVSDEDLEKLAGLLMHTIRANGKKTLTFETALDMLRANGEVVTELTAGRLSQVMRARGMHPDQLAQDTAAVAQRSLYPNHVWQVDASVCILYYLSNGTGLAAMDKDKFYKNKPGNFSRIANDRLIRYAAVDHASAAIKGPRYYIGSESADNLTDFLLWAFSQQPGDPMHGVPAMLRMDAGSANTAGLTRNLLKNLGVKLLINEVGNSRANGSVEVSHNLIERHFEGRLSIQPVASLEQLNGFADQWHIAFNSSKVHTRHRMTRYAAWLTILQEQLRIAPPIELLRDLVASEPETRRVSNTLTVSFSVKGHGVNEYDVRYVPGVMAGGKVLVAVSPYRVPAIDVAYTDAQGQQVWMTVAPVADANLNFRADAPVIGETLRSAPRTLADERRDGIAKTVYGVETHDEAEAARKAKTVAFGGRLDAMADVKQVQVPTYLPKRGTELAVEGRTVDAQRLTLVEACKRIKAAIGEAYGAHVYQFMQQRFGEAGVPEDQVAGIIAQFEARTDAPAADVTPKLRVVGGA